ncbi:microtubule-associated protein Jupiter isoform X2 [Nasonia vitripennis]|uniref:Microtubule-associated protein Jupiter n=1 Tax=Nasonia vitripennis TaxID=7425 RepID=A0A7M7IR73_NASVI|nr:microtubule-associated protein Jupiter isoform X2 [Nasonia vitripennis]
MATYAAYRHVELDNVGYGKKRVLKPPGGGSSDIFGAGGEVNSPRRAKHHNQSQLGSNFFGNGESQPSSNGSSAPETPRSNKPGNDSYKRLFGPPDARPPSTPNSKNHMRSNIALSSASSTEPNSPSRNGTALSHSSSNGSMSNGSSNAHLANGNGYHHNDVVAFRRIKRFRGSSCMPRNPVTGDGVDVKPHASRRIVRRSRDGNPVTGAGYEQPLAQQNGNANGGGSSASSDKSSTDSSPSANSNVPRMKNRVPPGGFSSGLW